MPEQKQVKIIGLRVENNNVIKVVELTPDIMQQRLIQIVGESGNGKSSLLDGLQKAIGGDAALKKKDALLPGFLAEAQLMDGDIKIFVGARCREISRGERKGDSIVETFLYAKDDNGKQYTPIIDGEEATAAKYTKLLTTELTFSMQDLFTENATAHRKLIEKLFKPELDALGADDVVAEIVAKREARDSARALCQQKGAYMESFEKEGWSDGQLSMLERVDVAEIETKISNKKIERDRLLHPTDDSYELAKKNIETERKDAVRELEKLVQAAKDAVRDDNDAKKTAYDTANAAFVAQEGRRERWASVYASTIEGLNYIFHQQALHPTITSQVSIRYDEIKATFTLSEPLKPVADPMLAETLLRTEKALEDLNATPIQYPEKEVISTTEIDAEIVELGEEVARAAAQNMLYDRYQLWLNWITAAGDYEVEVGKLRRMYASIDTGIKGMKIVPMDVNSDKVDVWIQYDGSYDPEFFLNTTGELRYIFSYSSFQRSAIGVMLQAARLNLKKKALRLAIVDDVAFTSKGLAVLSKLCEDLNVQLITCRTDDVDKMQIKDGEVMMEGGEAFFAM